MLSHQVFVLVSSRIIQVMFSIVPSSFSTGVRHLQTADCRLADYISCYLYEYMLYIPIPLSIPIPIPIPIPIYLYLYEALVWLTEVLVWLTQARVCKSAVCKCRTPIFDSVFDKVWRTSTMFASPFWFLRNIALPITN